MDVTSKTLQKLGPLSVQGSMRAFHEPPMRLTVHVKASAATPNAHGHTVGLTQTLVQSSRIATYEGGGTLAISTQKAPPCPDADEEHRPWYNQQCKGQAVPAAGAAPIELQLDDGPWTSLPPYCKDPQGNWRTPVAMKASEAFRISLYDLTAATVAKQWTWGYSYKLAKEAGKTVIRAHHESDLVEVAHSEIMAPTLDGAVATENPVFTWTPGWTPSD